MSQVYICGGEYELSGNPVTSYESHPIGCCYDLPMKCTCASKARFKRRTLHVPNLMQMSENNRFFSFALDSAHVKFDV